MNKVSADLSHTVISDCCDRIGLVSDKEMRNDRLRDDGQQKKGEGKGVFAMAKYRELGTALWRVAMTMARTMMTVGQSATHR